MAARSPARSTAGPLVYRTLTPSSRAMIVASVVLPRPGGPYSRTWSAASPLPFAARSSTSRLAFTSRWPMYSSRVRGRREPSTTSSPRSPAPAARRLRASSVIARSLAGSWAIGTDVRLTRRPGTVPSWRHDRDLHHRPHAPTPPPLVAPAEPRRPTPRRRRGRRRPRRHEDDDRAVAGRPVRPGARAAADPLGGRRGGRGGLPAGRLAAVHLGSAGPGRQAGPGEQDRRPVAAAARRWRGAAPRGTRGRRVRDRRRPSDRRDRVRRQRPSRRLRLRGRRVAGEGPQGRRRRCAPVRGLPDPPLGPLPGAARPAPVRGPDPRPRRPPRRRPRPGARGERVHVRGVGRGHRPRRDVGGRHAPPPRHRARDVGRPGRVRRGHRGRPAADARRRRVPRSGHLARRPPRRRRPLLVRDPRACRDGDAGAHRPGQRRAANAGGRGRPAPGASHLGPGRVRALLRGRRRRPSVGLPGRPARGHGDAADGRRRRHGPVPVARRLHRVRAAVLDRVAAPRRPVPCPHPGPGPRRARERHRRARDRGAGHRRAPVGHGRRRDADRGLAGPAGRCLGGSARAARRVRPRRAAQLVELVALALEPAHPGRPGLRRPAARPRPVDRVRAGDARPRLGTVGRHAVHGHPGQPRRGTPPVGHRPRSRGPHGRLVRRIHGQLGRRPDRPLPMHRDACLAVGPGRVPRHDRPRARMGARDGRSVRGPLHLPAQLAPRAPGRHGRREDADAGDPRGARPPGADLRGADPVDRHAPARGAGPIPVLPRREPLGAQAPERPDLVRARCCRSSTSTSVGSRSSATPCSAAEPRPAKV